ncbi:DUF1150 family protein [Pseudorhodobacter sp. E13]|uniref:DUF1150 family protein n=1 Tax=Pseudorhodobacter sp. E13 TaxID=2487931 RepID=UPI000F8EFD35|nr:DUF1150 family protein [Pseudorhodobacter sp. E13]RUS59863.1 DUF1150 family protein [Pseudorhodobacter sp. E13]
MDTPFENMPTAAERIVYVRAVSVADLPQDVQDQAEGLKTIYAVHRGDGARLALVADKRLAFALAREHDLAPVSVH